MFCRKCGNQFDNSLDLCPQCNEPVPETARQKEVNAEPPAAPGTKRCPECRKENKAEAKFCAGCGADLTKAERPADMPVFTAPEINGSPDNSDTGYALPEDGAVTAKQGLPVKAVVIGAAAIVLVLIILLVFLLSGGSNEPVPALLRAAENLVDEVKDAKGMHIEMDIDGENVDIDYQLNIRKKEFIFFIEADGNEIGGYIFEDEGRVAEEFGGDYYTEKIKGKDAETFWSSLENKNYEDNELLTTYFDKKKVDKAVKAIFKGLDSKDFQTELADALEIEYDKKSGEYTYSAELNAKGVGEAIEILFEMIEERTEDYAEKELDDVLDEVFDGAKMIKSEGKSFSLGDVEWVIKKGKLQSFEYELEYTDYWDDTEKYTVSGELEYGFGGLESIEIDGSFDGDKFSIEISDIDKVDDVKELMSKSMLKELKLNK
ncbi:MAG: zinc ribbon domain-containing protein [Alistipes sp.]|nr:zinc ribbon domain-containing protein [Alistipes sp.]